MKHIHLAFSMFSFMAVSSGLDQDRQVYCQVDHEDNLQDWRLTCLFQEDISESRKGFQVYRINRAGSADVVVNGDWINDEPIIHTARGYQHVGLVSDKVSFRMKRDVVHHGGIYLCVLPPALIENVKTCRVPEEEELRSPMVTTQLSAPAQSKGWRHVTYKELLIFTVAVIIYGQFSNYFQLFPD